MFKKFLSLALVVMMLMSVVAISVSAAQVEVADGAAPVDDQASQGADEDKAADGADEDKAATGASTITYDNSVTNWAGPIIFYVYDPETGEALVTWGSKNKGGGTDNGDGTWSKDISDYGLQDGKQYCIIFNDSATNAQTYDLMMDTSCYGDTAKATGNSIENPVDSTKTAIEAKWNSNSLGPRKQVTSIGNVVGETIPSFTNAKDMLVSFLKDTLANALQYSGKDEQTLIDDTAKALGLGVDDVVSAISESGATTTWDKSKSSLGSGSGDSGSSGGSSSGSSGGSSSGSSGGSSSGSSGGSSSGSSSSSKSGSASNTQTGQEETVLFIMLGVMVAAAGVIFFMRKKERA